MQKMGSELLPKDRYSVTMIYLAVLAVLSFHFLVHVDGAHRIDVNDRFRYSIYRDWQQVNRHPTLHSLLGLPEDVTLQLQSSSATVHGKVKERYRQLYKGLEVIGTSVEADMVNGRYDDGQVTGTMYLSLKNDMPSDLSTCTLTEEEAIDIVFAGENFPSSTHIKSEQIVGKYFVDSDKKAHYAFAVTLLVRLSSGQEARPYYVIDRCDESILQKFQKLQTSTTGSYETLAWDTGATDSWVSPSPKTAATSPVTGTTTTTTTTTQAPTTATTQTPTGCTTYVKGTGGNPKIGEIKYSEAPYKYCLDVTVSGDTCTLDNKFIKVVDLQNTNDTDKETPIQFTCADGIPNPVTNGAYNPKLDAHFYGTVSFKTFEDWYGIYPLKSKPKMMVHFGNGIGNAYWNGQAMLFGDGDTQTYPFVSLNIVAHELSHGITGQNSDLTYAEQSGGINEAFSDIAGELVEYYAKGTYDWKIGFDVFKDPTTSMRYFDDPTKDGYSIGKASDFKSGMDVHESSGVYNNVFYRTVEDGKIPIRYAFESFLIANQKYWKQDTDFENGACGTVRGAYDAGLDTEKFVDAFKAVGLTPCKLTSFLEMLTESKQRTGVRVSTIRRPLFGIKTRSDTKKITVTAASASGADVTIDLLTSARNSAAKTGTGSVAMTAEPDVLYYVRAYTGSDTEINDVTVSLQLSTTP